DGAGSSSRLSIPMRPGPRRSPNLFWHEIAGIASIRVRRNLTVKKPCRLDADLRSRGAWAVLAASWRCVIKTLGAADKGIAALEKTKQLIGGASDADANAFGDGTHGIVDFAEPEFFIRAEIDAVVAAIDLQRLCQAPRTARKMQELGGFAMALHDFDS